MLKYTVLAEITIARRYETVVTRVAHSPEEALEGAHWEALGLSYELLERLCTTEPHTTRLLESFTQDAEVSDPEDDLEDDGDADRGDDDAR
jgi:hypothetical protein